MATSKIKTNKIQIGLWESISAIPFEAPCAGFIRYGINPSSASGGKASITIYEDLTHHSDYKCVATTGDAQVQIIPVNKGAYISALTATGGTEYKHFAKAEIV